MHNIAAQMQTKKVLEWTQAKLLKEAQMIDEIRRLKEEQHLALE